MELLGDSRLRKWVWVPVADCVLHGIEEEDIFLSVSHSPALL